MMRAEVIGHYSIGLTQTPIYRYVSFDCGPGKSGFVAQFHGRAPRNNLGELDVRALKHGDILVHPEFIYRRIPWTGTLMSGHLNALRFYKPKTIIKSDVDSDAAPIDLGVVHSNLIQ